jgi:hypothetical protein
MLTLREHGLTRTATVEERIDVYGTWFDADVDPATTLISLIERLGINLERIVGKDRTAKAFATLTDSDDWREAISETDFYLETDLGDALCNLSAYAVFGLSGHGFKQDGTIQETLQTVEDLLRDCQQDQWLPKAELEPLLPTLRMARARWNLDHGDGLDPEGLALLGGVKLSRIRNMMSGYTPELPKDTMGLIANEAARSWLEKRDCFLPTVVAAGESFTEVQSPTIVPVFVPVARDGSMFTPDLMRNGGYQIGDKGAEEKIANYHEALSRLQAMPTAKWRRPNENDNWGIVAAIEWRRVDLNTL